MSGGVEKMSDEDFQAFTMQKITDILIAGGYFRARISGLTEFDRVVGGLSWAITASGVPINVDVQFKENANIGEKIMISEQIVIALLEMDCPCTLEPHHIQGLKLNCQPLFPVVQWLVKSVIDYRRITGDRVRNFSNFLFDVTFDRVRYSNERQKQQLLDNENEQTNTAIDAVDVITNEDGREFYDHILSNYSMKRKFCKQKDIRFSTAESFVDATLLEYGFLFRAQRAFGGENEDLESKVKDQNSTSSKSKIALKFGALMTQMGHSDNSTMNVLQKSSSKKSNLDLITEENAEEEEKRLLDLQTQITNIEKNSLRMSGNTIAGIIDSQLVQNAKEIQISTEEYSNQALLNSGSTINKELIFDQRRQKLKSRYKELTEAKKLKIDQYTKINENVEELEMENMKLRKKNSKILQAMNDLQEIEDQSTNKNLLQKLKLNVMKNEEIKNAMNKYKKQCFEYSNKFSEELNELENISQDPKEIERQKKVQILYKKDIKKFDKIRNS